MPRQRPDQKGFWRVWRSALCQWLDKVVIEGTDERRYPGEPWKEKYTWWRWKPRYSTPLLVKHVVFSIAACAVLVLIGLIERAFWS